MAPTPPTTRRNTKGQAKDKTGDNSSSAAASVLSRPSSSEGEGSATKAGSRERLSGCLSDEEFLERLAARVADKLFDRLSDIITSRFVSEFEPRLLEMERRMETLVAEVGVMREEAAAREQVLESRIDDQEQYHRRNNVRVFGVPEAGGEDVTAVITGLFSDKLDLQIDTSLIDRCHRVGRVPAPGESRRPRPILIKFISYQTRRDVLSVRRRLKGTSITIREDLTRRRNQFYQEVAKRVGFRNTWSVDGRILWRENGKICSSQRV
jgi:hypothetical protein